jgi:hypothetical protein
MKRIAGAVFCFVALVAVAISARAQMGMDLFKRPPIAKVFHPVVGKGAVYESTSKTGGSARSIEMAVVAKESADGKDGYWMQFAGQDEKGGQFVGKALITVDDLQFHRMIVQPPGQGAMEFPANMFAKNRERMQENMNEWQSVGSDTITVPAGTFSCEHWKNKNDHEAWTSDKVYPFGLVKESQPGSSMVLVKVLDNVSDRITGPVKPFDMQQMMQQMQQQRQHPN